MRARLVPALRRSQAAVSGRPLTVCRPFSQSCPLRKDAYRPKSVADFLTWKPSVPVPDVSVHGFVRSVRTMKASAFIAVGDGSSLAPMQALVPASLADGLANGAAVRLTGSWVQSPAKGQTHELHVKALDILGPSDAKTFPIQKKYQSPEFLRTLPHLRPRVPFHATLLQFRSAAIASLNRFFVGRDFVQTHPPLITSSDCEGAGEVFSLTTAGEARDNDNNDNNDKSLFFRAPKYLTVSTQLHLEALAQAVGNVWTLSPTFRAEESDTPRHLSEFYMLEAELGFADRLPAVMDLLEDMLRALAADLRAHHPRLYDELLERPPRRGGDDGSSSSRPDYLPPPETVAARWDGLAAADRWPRITYTAALDLLAAAPEAFQHGPPPVWGAALQTEHEKFLAQAVGGGRTPVFVTHYPRASKAFYMRPSDDGDGGRDTVDCFDLLVPEFCEIAGGSMREHRLAPLVAAMQSRGMRVAGSDGAVNTTTDSADLDWYVDLRRWGCPPHGGFGLGFDRLLCYLSGVPTIRDTVAFPRWFGRCDC